MPKLWELVKQQEEALAVHSKNSMTLQSANQSATNQNKVLTRELNFLKAKIKALESRPIQKELDRLKEQLAEEREKPAVKKLNKRLEELQKQLYEATSKNAPIQEVQSKLDAMCKEVEKLRKAIVDKDMKIGVQQKEIDNLLVRLS